MLKSLSKTAWTIGAGVLLTGIFAGGAYYVEARQIQVLAANVVEDQFDKAGFSLAAARTETYAAGALAGTSTVSYAMLKNALPRLQFRSGEQPLWLWARVVPAADIPALGKPAMKDLRCVASRRVPALLLQWSSRAIRRAPQLWVST